MSCCLPPLQNVETGAENYNHGENFWWRADGAASRAGTAQFAKQPRPREAPIPVDALLGYVEDHRRLLHAETAKKAQLDNPGLSSVELRKIVQRLIERDKVILTRHRKTIIECDPNCGAA